MSTTSADAPSSSQANITLTEKQERVRMCLTACLNSPPRFDLRIDPGRGCTFAATFDKTAAGVRFASVKTSSDKIIVSAESDLSSVEVNFERLTAATGLENVEETKEIWESIKRLVKSDPPAKVVPETAEDTLDVERGSAVLPAGIEKVALGDIREKLSLIAVDPSKIHALAALLYDIRHGRVKILKSPDQDDGVHDAAKSIDLNGDAPRVGSMGERTGAKARMVVLNIPSFKRKHSHTSAADDDLGLPAESSRRKATTTLLGQSKHLHNNSGRLARPGLRHLGRSTSPLSHAGKKISTNVHKAAPEALTNKRKHRATIAAHDASSLRARPSGVRTTAALSSKSKHSSSASSRPSSGHFIRRSTATHRSTGQDRSDSMAVINNSRNGKRKGEDGPFGEGNTPQAPMKRRMAMKEESFKGSE